MTIEITGRGIIISITAAAVIIAAFISGYRIGYNKRRQEIFDLECELKMMGRITDGMSEDLEAIRTILSSDGDTETTGNHLTVSEDILPTQVN